MDNLKIEEEKLSYMETGYIQGLRVLADTFKMSFVRHFVYGILAGIWIGVAYTTAIFVAENIANASLAKFIIGSIFPLVILLIFFLGGQFFTAYTYALSTTIRGLCPWKEALKAMGAVYIGNIIGCFVFCIILELTTLFSFDQKHANFLFNTLAVSKFYSAKADVIDAIVNNKNMLANINIKNILICIVATFFSSILCNMLVSNTVAGGKSTKGNIVASMIMFWTIVFMFATAGYQHCVANWHIASLLILMGWFKNSVDINMLNGTTIHHTVGMQIGWLFVLLSIIPSIFGNIIGALFIGELLYIVNKKNAKILIAERKLINKNYKSI